MSHSQTLRRVSQEYVIDLYLRPPVSRFRLMDFHLMDRIVRDANRSALLPFPQEAQACPMHCDPLFQQTTEPASFHLPIPPPPPHQGNQQMSVISCDKHKPDCRSQVTSYTTALEASGSLAKAMQAVPLACTSLLINMYRLRLLLALDSTSFACDAV